MISLRSVVRHIGQSFVQADGLPFFPFNLRYCSYLGKGNPKNLGDMLFDSAVIGGLAFISVLAADLITGTLPSIKTVYAASLMFASTFLTQLAAERRIKVAKKEII